MFLDETGSYEELDDSIIPVWMFDTSDRMNESSLIMHENLDCIIERESFHQDSFRRMQGSEPELVTEPVRPPPNLEYIRVSYSNFKIKTVFILYIVVKWLTSECT